MGISLGNNFEAKVRDKDYTATGPKKVVLLNNLNISTAHNFAADSLRWSPLRMSTGLSLFKNKMSINLGGTFDPYALNENNVKVNTYNIAAGGGLMRLTSANVNLNYSFSSTQFENPDNEVEDRNQRESTSSGVRDDDLFGKAEDFTDRRMTEGNGEPPPKYPSYRSKIHWDLKLAYYLTYNNYRNQRDFSNNSVMFSGNVELTPM